ncbi:MAG: hydroxyacid dehydrogenase, partial [Bacillota bacterium]
EISPLISKKNVAEYKEFLSDCEIAFATWGMTHYTVEEIKQHFPSLKILFYSAGTVQTFASEFLECGIRVCSANYANAIPVAEYTFAQIALATKGFFRSAKNYKLNPLYALKYAYSCDGNFATKVGLVGLGVIGSLVAEKLKGLDVEVLACDPFVSAERAAALGVKLVSKEELFATCDVISNHLANKKELNNVYNFKLFHSMKKYATFINTGRGAQVNECGLALSLLLRPSTTAVLDVIKAEFFPYVSPLFYMRNAILTPHVAGSIGKETMRMAHFMMDELQRYVAGEELKYEVKAEMLAKMA